MSTPLSFVGMTNFGGVRLVQATAALNSTEQTSVRMAFPQGVSDRAVKLQVLSRTSIAGTHQCLITLKLSGIDLWNLSPVDLSNAQYLEVSNQSLLGKGTSTRYQHWVNVPMMAAKALPAGTLTGYRLLDDGSILIQFKKTSNFVKTESTLL